MAETTTCVYCGRAIEKARIPNREGGRVWRWKSEYGFYCPKAGGDCWHEPAKENR